MRKGRIKMRKGTQRIIKFAKRLIEKIKDNDVSGMAAQLAYFFLLSLFPMLIFMVTLLPYTPFSQEDIFNVIKDVAPTDTLNMIRKNLNDIMENRSGGLLSIGVIGTIWSASKGMNALIRSLNRAYEVEEERSFFVSRSLAVILTIAMIFVFLIALLLPVFGKQIGMFIFSQLGLSEAFLQIWGILRWLLSPFILFLVFFIIYLLAPSTKIHFKNAAPGALIASLGWILVSLAFSFYVSNFGNYTSTYGSIGGVIVLMLWFYISGMIIIVGGEMNSLIVEERKKKKLR